MNSVERDHVIIGLTVLGLMLLSGFFFGNIFTGIPLDNRWLAGILGVVTGWIALKFLEHRDQKFYRKKSKKEIEEGR